MIHDQKPFSMKKTIILLVLIVATIRCFPESMDSLKALRELLYTEYSTINLPDKELSKNDYEKMMSILKEVVIVDSKIINQLSDFDKKTSAYNKQIRKLNTDKTTLNNQLAASEDKTFIVEIVCGMLVCLLVVSLICLVAFNIRFRKIKKKSENYTEALKMSDNDRQALQHLNEVLHAKDREVSEKNVLITGLQEETKQLKEKLIETGNKLEELQKLPPPVNIEQNETPDPNILKLEKLGRMRDMGIVTEDEFNTFKKKFLGDL